MSVNKVKFYSNALGRTIEAEVIEERKATVKLRLADGNIIIKKWRQLCQ